MSETGYIYNQSEDGTKANILIDGYIDSTWGNNLVSMSKDIANSNANEVMLQINSGGGQVTEGRAMEAYIKGSPKNIHTSVLGFCGSIATFPAMAGKTTSIAKGSLFMIHKVQGGEWGEGSDLRQTADLIDLMDDQIANGYVDAIARNGKLINGSKEETKEQVISWMANTTFFTAEQAVEHGFIQKLSEGVEFVNKAQAQNILNQCSKYKNVPTEFLNNFKNIVNMAENKPTVTDAENKGFLESFKAMFKSKEGKALIAEGVKNAKDEEAQALENAKALLIANGISIEPEKEVEVEEEKPAAEAKAEAPTDELTTLKAQLAEAKAEADRLKLEKEAAPTARAKEGKATEKGALNKEEQAFFNQGAQVLLNRN